ncbi:ASCH domain-containing protein [Sphingomonadaceae bacterium G21617-S1]|nr:ASCH domain-containing protein [Sphingomonadaceae bacterium G21617-S1]
MTDLFNALPPLRAISLWQPWASGIPLGLKAIETRHWSTKYRGDIAIHAAKRWTREQRAFWAAEEAAGRLPPAIPFGVIVAVARIVDVRPTEELVDGISDIERLYGNYAPGRFGWLLEEVRPLRSNVLCPGRQSMWTLSADLAARVREQLP